MKISTLLVLIISFFTTLSYGSPIDSIQDTVPLDNPDYIGYRMAITSLSASPNKKGDLLKINYTIINTGRQDLLFGKKITPPPHLVVNFDHSLKAHGLVPYAAEIRDAIINTDFHVASGKISKSSTIKIALRTENQAIGTQKPEIASTLENPRLRQPISKEKEVFTAKAAPVDDFEKALAGSKKDYDENACSDLVFESIRVVKKTRNKVILEYTIVNQGQGPAKLITNRKNENKNMALQAYMSTRDRVTKSSFSFDGSFLEKGLDKSNGKLYPGEKYTNTIKLNIQKMTKFTPYVILELDPYLSIYECDKKNNKFAVKVGEGIEDQR